jgi:NADP-dependent 3-hydroxy acid dehydrogenase YdfG
MLNVTRAVLPSMRQRRSGHIINLSSICGYSAYEGFGVYSSTKFAVEGPTEALVIELRLAFTRPLLNQGSFGPISWTRASRSSKQQGVSALAAETTTSAVAA